VSFFDAISGAVSKAADVVSSTASAIADGVTNVVNKARDAANKAVDWILDKARQAGEAISKAAAWVFDKAKQAFSAVKAAALKIVCKVKKALQPKPVSTGLGKKVDDLVAKSPKLTENLKKLEGKCDIVYGEAGKGTYYDKNALPRPKIVIDPNDKDNPESVVQSLAHESGHALYTLDPYVPPDGLTKEEYVAKNVNRNLKDEGEATMTNAEVRREILDNGGPDIGVAGSQSEKYKKIAEKYPDPKDRDKARQEIGDVFADGETPSGSQNAGKTYRDYYGKPYADHYDKTKTPSGS
jgi:type VI secretion system secreted protein VgrG